ncbi:ArsR/SmtB family transcription factor [Streptomyces hoynatensis]|uniref:ArsR family transcriptional regulator n=1 Tax=Streptomyces hoynatensis TaxID=1141874 RepID=A0A3A9Z6S4_9ACTN|nr:helix-turn-helix domain-containing protein [Streptomyces hoynatensis]RKN43007.1 ArsR family transcriptional regulator [Streptomyces hoynatensis]
MAANPPGPADGAPHQAPDTPSPPSPPPPRQTPSLDGLKALAQPRRLKILEWLARKGPATSAMLARELGLNTGATSYHVRELARHGFVEVVEGRGQGRERWWRAVAQDLRFPPPSRRDAETSAVVRQMNRLAYASDLRLFDELQEAAQRAAAEGEADPWQDGFPYSRGTVRLTLDELRELFEEYIALLNRYKRPDHLTPPDARTVLTRFLAFPASHF